MLIVLTIIGVWLSIIPAIIRTSTADLCNQTDPFSFTIRLDETYPGGSNVTNCGVDADIRYTANTEANTDSGCAELTESKYGSDVSVIPTMHVLYSRACMKSSQHMVK